MAEEKDILAIIITGSLTVAGLLLVFLIFFVSSIERTLTILARITKGLIDDTVIQREAVRDLESARKLRKLLLKFLITVPLIIAFSSATATVGFMSIWEMPDLFLIAAKMFVVLIWTVPVVSIIGVALVIALDRVDRPDE